MSVLSQLTPYTDILSSINTPAILHQTYSFYTNNPDLGPQGRQIVARSKQTTSRKLTVRPHSICSCFHIFVALAQSCFTINSTEL